MKQKAFEKETKHYESEAPKTPYLRARQEWDDRVGAVVVQNKNWRLVGVLSLIVSIVLVILLCISFAMRKNVVYVAEVTHGGRVVNVAPMLVPYEPNEAQKEYFIGQFIQLVRGVPLDPVVAKNNWLKAYAFLTRSGSEEFNQMMQKTKALQLIGKKTVTVSVNDVNPLSKNTFQADWTETIVDLNSQDKKEVRYSGVFTVFVKQPEEERQILQNPLGVYIDNFHISTRD